MVDGALVQNGGVVTWCWYPDTFAPVDGVIGGIFIGFNFCAQKISKISEQVLLFLVKKS